MRANVPQYIEIRQNRAGLDRPFIIGTRVRVQDIVSMHERFGHSVDEIARDFPHISLAQVHGALAYFFEDRKAIWQCIQEDAANAESVREELTKPTPTQQGTTKDSSSAAVPA